MYRAESARLELKWSGSCTRRRGGGVQCVQASEQWRKGGGGIRTMQLKVRGRLLGTERSKQGERVNPQQVLDAAGKRTLVHGLIHSVSMSHAQRGAHGYKSLQLAVNWLTGFTLVDVTLLQLTLAAGG